jgi:hypothetical protein
MKVADAFVLLSPLVVARLSDSLSVGLIDAAWIVLVPFMMTRPTLAFSNWPAFWSLSFLAMVFATAGVNFTLHGGGVRDLAVLRIGFIMVPLLYALSLPPDVARVERLTKVFILSGGAAILIGVALHLAGVQVRTEQQMLWIGNGTGPTTRAGGILGNSSDYGLFASTWGSICGLLVLALWPRRRWFWFLAISGLATYAVWISASRAGLVHLAIAWAIGLPFLMKSHNWVFGIFAAIITAPVALLLLPGASLVLPESVAFTLRRLDFLNLSGDTSFYQSVRLVNWAILGGVGIDNWPIGIGYRGIAENYGSQGIFGDNAFLTVFVEFGLFTLICYVGLWLTFILAGIRNVRRSTFGAVLAAVILSELFHALTLDTFTVWYSMPFTWFFSGLLYKSVGIAPKRARKKRRRIVLRQRPVYRSA